MQDFGSAAPPETDAIGSVHSQAILDALPLPVFAIDADYAIVPCNRAAAEHLRKRADASFGVRNNQHAEPRCHEILYGRSQICPYCPTINELQSDPENDAADTRSGQDYEDIIEKVIPVRTPGGDERSIRLHFISLNTTEGSGLPTDSGTYQLIETLEDITIRQQKQEEALRMENLAALGIMISGIAHELNNPLTGIGLNLQNLQANLESMAPPEIQHRLGILQKDLHRASRIVSDILSFSSPGKPRLTRASIVQTIQKAIDNTMRLYPILSRQVQWKFQPDLEDEFFAYDTEKVER
ncbi:MAG: hypothetical protein KDK27_15115, partial [Leptospiraceae bacterium]|nr:hypothetical protein [Leptospiraceae bacterium]